MNLRAAVLLLGFGVFLTGQEPVFRATTRLVEIGVVVHQKKDQKGAVTDLTADDFKIFDEGRRQKIVVFRKNGPRIMTDSSAAEHCVFTNRSEVNPEEPRGVTIFLLDALNTQFADQAQAKAQFLKLLAQIRPDDRIGVYVLGRQLRVLQEFTSDSQRLTDAVRRNPAEITRQMDIFRDAGASDASKDQARIDRAQITASAMEAIARQVAGVPGRKNLIWISAAFPIDLVKTRLQDPNAHTAGGVFMAADQGGSGGTAAREKVTIQLSSGTRHERVFTPEIDRITRALNAANIAMYPVDARGMVLVPDESPRPSPSGFATMERVAEQTGGLAFHDTNDIQGAIAKALEDSEAGYTLGFYPDAGQLDSSFHALKVEVNRPGMEVRARRGYIAAPEEKAGGPAWKGRVSEALMSPLEESGIALSARLDSVNKQLAIRVAAADLTFHRDGDRWNGDLDVVLSGQGLDGRNVGNIEDEVRLAATSSERDTMMKEGIPLTVPFPPTGTAQVRVVVLDRNSGRVGSLSLMLGQ